MSEPRNMSDTAPCALPDVGARQARDVLEAVLAQAEGRGKSMQICVLPDFLMDQIRTALKRKLVSGGNVVVPRKLLESITQTRPHRFGCVCALCEDMDRLKAALASPAPYSGGEEIEGERSRAGSVEAVLELFDKVSPDKRARLLKDALARVAELEQALKPFADVAPLIPKDWADDQGLGEWALCLDAGDLRAAASALGAHP